MTPQRCIMLALLLLLSYTLFSCSVYERSQIVKTYPSPSQYPPNEIKMDIYFYYYGKENADSIFWANVSFETIKGKPLRLKKDESVTVIFDGKDNRKHKVEAYRTKENPFAIGRMEENYMAYSPIFTSDIKGFSVLYTNSNKTTYTSTIKLIDTIQILSPQPNDTFYLCDSTCTEGGDTFRLAWNGDIKPAGGGCWHIRMGSSKTISELLEDTTSVSNEVTYFPKELYFLNDKPKSLNYSIGLRWEVKGVTDPRLSQESYFKDEFLRTVPITFINLKANQSN